MGLHRQVNGGLKMGNHIERAFSQLTNQGYKVLLREYECALGKVDFIAKKDGALVFLMVNKPCGAKVKRVALYYKKRYGIPDVPIRLETVHVDNVVVVVNGGVVTDVEGLPEGWDWKLQDGDL